MTYVFIAAGAVVGAPLRYFLLQRFATVDVDASFPVGTTVVNITGCLLIGILGAIAEEHDLLSREARVFLIVGLLGSYTTFSTFGWETLTLLRNDQVATALGYVALSNIGGVLAAWAGLVCVRVLSEK